MFILLKEKNRILKTTYILRLVNTKIFGNIQISSFLFLIWNVNIIILKIFNQVLFIF